MFLIFGVPGLLLTERVALGVLSWLFEELWFWLAVILCVKLTMLFIGVFCALYLTIVGVVSGGSNRVGATITIITTLYFSAQLVGVLCASPYTRTWDYITATVVCVISVLAMNYYIRDIK